MRAPTLLRRPTRLTRSVVGGMPIAALCLAGAIATGCAQLPRDINGSPPTARLVPNAIPPAPITPEQKQKLDVLNQQILTEQENAIARQQQADAYARAASYAYPSSMSLYYGGWGGGGWGGGLGFGFPVYRGWGGYPYW